MSIRWVATSAVLLSAIAAFFFLSSTRGKAPGPTPDTVELLPASVRENAPSEPLSKPETRIALATSSTVPPLAEPALMVRLRSLVSSEPAAAVELARDGNRRFPSSPDAPERTSILIHALAALGKSAEARGEAEFMVNHHPDSAWVREIERFTGAHRHRNARLNDAGGLEYYDP